MDKDLIWKNALGQLRLNVSEGIFSAFLKQLSLGAIRDVDETRQLVEVNCPSSFVRDTVEQRFWGQIKTILDGMTEKKNELVFSVKAIENNEAKNSRSRTKEANPEGTVAMFDTKSDEGEFMVVAKKAGLREFFTFEAFAVSSSNQMAHAAAIAVSDKPGTAYNPLFLWGGVGVGKTHLMQGIGNNLLRRRIDTKIVYCSGEEFTNDIVEGIKTKSMDRVRAKYRKVQLLLIDDIQFIAGKEAVQEEFFHTFNDVQRVGGQVVLTSDRQPHEISKLEDRLRSRFEAGLIVDISPPDFALRSAIALIKAEQKGLPIDPDVAQAIATYADSARKIEGLLTKLLTVSRVNGEQITPEAVKRMAGIKEEGENGAKIITPAIVIEIAALKFGVSVAQIKGGRRNVGVVIPRMTAMYILRTDLKYPFEEIGRLIGGRDHSTVMHAVGKIETIMPDNPGLRHQVSEIRKEMFGKDVDKSV